MLKYRVIYGRAAGIQLLRRMKSNILSATDPSVVTHKKPNARMIHCLTSRSSPVIEFLHKGRTYIQRGNEPHKGADNVFQAATYEEIKYIKNKETRIADDRSHSRLS